LSAVNVNRRAVTRSRADEPATRVFCTALAIIADLRESFGNQVGQTRHVQARPSSPSVVTVPVLEDAGGASFEFVGRGVGEGEFVAG
jgi:hypothetical protein